MADILIESGLKEKVEALIGRRRDVMTLGLDQDYLRRTGHSHLVAVSGSNVG